MDDIPGALGRLTDIFTTAQAKNVGLNAWALHQLLRYHQIERAQRGLYRKIRIAGPGSRWAKLREEHLARARIALAAHPGHAVSHQTGAAVRGWAVSLHPESPVNLTALTVEPRSRRGRDLWLHHSDSIVNDVDVIDGMPCLTAARTVADCLRLTRSANGVAIADSALRVADTTLAEVAATLGSQRRWTGKPRAQQALSLIDPRRETWLESYSFVTLHELGIELPTPQVEVFDAAGSFVGRVDGMWIDRGVVAEADGETKYLMDERGAVTADPEATSRRIVAERWRERDVERTGLVVVRWTTHEIRHQDVAVAERVRAAWRRGDRGRFRGRLRVDGRWFDPASDPPPDTR